MLKLIDTSVVKEEVRQLVLRLRAGKRLALHFGAGTHPDQIVRALSAELGDTAVVARVPASLDCVAHTILELASAGGSDCLASVDGLLREQTPLADAEALNIIGDTLAGRSVVIERIERLAPAVAADDVVEATADRSEALWNWLLGRADVVTSSARLRSADRALVSIRHPSAPVTLANGEPTSPGIGWDGFDDASTFEVALALEATGIDPVRIVAAPSDELRRALMHEVPQGTADLLKMLALDATAIPLDVVQRLDVNDEAYRVGLDLALWRERSGALVVAEAWSQWCARVLPPTERLRLHRQLAEVFAKDVIPEDASAGRAAFSVLAAHRHLVQVNDIPAALRYAAYGAELLIDAARRLSLAGDYPAASDLYERILDRPYLPRRLRGYAKHYYHFNRSHAQPEMETVHHTADGYAESVQHWPENAIFWSRLVRALFFCGEGAKAHERLAEARRRVPEHPDKASRLISRTARRLAEMGRLVDAAEVWADFQPTTPRTLDDWRRLQHLLRDGWQSDRLEVRGRSALILRRREHFRVLRLGGGWRVSADNLGNSALAGSPLEALKAFVTQVADDVRRLVSTLDRDLDDEGRRRKALLLSWVDVAASGLDAGSAPTTWVYGRVVRGDQGLVLVAGGNIEGRYPIIEEVARNLVLNDHPYLAEVDADRGKPVGPVRNLERLLRDDPEEIWRRWQERLTA